MTIADFFVSIGLKGDDKTVAGLKNVQGGLKEAAGNAIALKAAVLAAVYGLQQMTAASTAHGTALVEYNALTDISIKRTQEWGNAFRQVGVSENEVMATMNSLQQDAAKWQMGDSGVTKAFAWMGDAGIGIDGDKFIQDNEYRMNKIISYLKSEKNAARRNEVAHMLGLGDNFIQGAVRGEFNEKTFSMGGVLTDKSVNQLNKIDITLENVFRHLRNIRDVSVAEHGMFFVDEFSKATKFIERFNKQIEKLVGLKPLMVEVFSAIGIALYAALGPIGPIVAGLALVIAELEKVAEGKDNAFSKIGKYLQSKGLSMDSVKDLSDLGGGDPMKHFGGEKAVPDFKAPDKGSSGAPNIKQENVFNVGPGQDPEEFADAVQPHLNRAGQQMFSNVQLV